ncbi:unnamed protein product [Coffea canephora]|uniref:Uncharacterized protein n=1 Tax=Coffea canephora TaxID=49390 RepID=A0A068UI05_COFCA|nr:unnamed protein product [Coffea canephora]
MGSPDAATRSIPALKRPAFLTVVMIVAVTPCPANTLAMSIMGIMCPGDNRGNDETAGYIATRPLLQ